MLVERRVIEANLERVRDRIARALERAGRPRDATRLVAVTKGVGPEEIRVLHDLGVSDFGENRLPEATAKIEALPPSIRWHMVGAVQRRKARDVVRLFDRVDSVDRVELAEALDKRCEDRPAPLPVLLEVNIAGETAKHGFAPEAVARALEAVRTCANLRVEGLMTLAPLFRDPEQARPLFARLRGLADELNLEAVSMGMSNDFEVAVQEGATEVRIGSALFKG